MEQVKQPDWTTTVEGTGPRLPKTVLGLAENG